MNARLFALPFVLSLSALAATEGQEIPLWNNGAPGTPATFPNETWTERGKDGVRDRSVEEVHVPTITVYLPDSAKATGAAVVICPGGGFSHLAIDKEGHDIARWLNSNGIAGFVVKYRLSKNKVGNYTVDTALADVQRAIRTVHYRAAEWHVDPARIGSRDSRPGVPSSNSPEPASIMASTIRRTRLTGRVRGRTSSSAGTPAGSRATWV